MRRRSRLFRFCHPSRMTLSLAAGTFSDYIFRRSCCDNCADLHSLCHIAWMIDFIYLSCCQTDLVSVGAVACGRGRHQLSLGQLARSGF